MYLINLQNALLKQAIQEVLGKKSFSNFRQIGNSDLLGLLLSQEVY